MSSSNGSNNYFVRPLVTTIKLDKVLTPNASDPDVTLPNDQKAFRLEITSTDGLGNPIHIFVHQTEQMDPNNPDSRVAMFTNVASANDWQELPESIPTDPNVIIFRYYKAVAIARSAIEADFIWQAVKNDVANLVKLHKLLLSPPTNTTQNESISFT